jgi:hypothetical protein
MLPVVENHPESPEQKGAIMFRKVADLARFIENYRYYRRSGRDPKEAWHLAGLTLP